jgi:hypothetical protein
VPVPLAPLSHPVEYGVVPIRHLVKTGDCLLSIAGTHGFHDWEAIWKLPDNDELRERRTDATVLAEGDEVFLPDPAPKVVVVDTNQRHRIVISLPPTAVRAQVLHLDGKPIADCKCLLQFGDQKVERQTDADGWFEAEVPCLEERLVLTLHLTGDTAGPRYAWRLYAGHLNPVESASGVRQRLTNLGYWPLDEEDEGALPYGLRAFQEDHDLDASGEANDETRAKLKEAHGGI